MNDGPLVVKVGGTGVDDPASGSALWRAVIDAHEVLEGKLVLVHGGGRAVDQHLTRLGLKTERIDGLRVTPSTLDKLLARHQPGDTVRIHAFRRDELMEFTVRLDPPLADNARLAIGEGAYPLRKQWLGD